MAPKYELFYFQTAGRAGVARLMFRLANVEFTDTRYDFQEEWNNHKTDVKRFPLQRMPTLQVGDQIIFEGAAINRYLAEELGFNGDSALERAKMNTVNSLVMDIWFEWAKFIMEKDEDKKTKGMNNMFDVVGKKIFTCMEDLLKRENQGKAFFLPKLSLADVGFLDLCLLLEPMRPTFLDSFPLLKGLIERLCATPAVAEYKKQVKNFQ